MAETTVIRRIETAINDALHPKGMSTHDGIARVQAADLQYLMSALAATRCPIGLDEQHEICSAGTCHKCLAKALAAALAENEALKRDAERLDALEAEQVEIVKRDGNWHAIYWLSDPLKADSWHVRATLREAIDRALEGSGTAPGWVEVAEAELWQERAEARERALTVANGQITLLMRDKRKAQQILLDLAKILLPKDDKDDIDNALALHCARLILESEDEYILRMIEDGAAKSERSK